MENQKEGTTKPYTQEEIDLYMETQFPIKDKLFLKSQTDQDNFLRRLGFIEGVKWYEQRKKN